MLNIVFGIGGNQIFLANKNSAQLYYFFRKGFAVVDNYH